ncbi:hypothetical protein Mal4_15290 [Maioricimonas rarisocia]|uniref:Uncharacterized protein n=1 Tax=Maioricimonas rarisocia TaxID=2528026 RepID=A0A517Z410_9PLAN|nr:hypothetical protein [Maioricimonas rarisocia]QDU37219.1 hypothetical protein Mal4_15290 [Maioricimonas rarisocia]
MRCLALTAVIPLFLVGLAPAHAADAPLEIDQSIEVGAWASYHATVEAADDEIPIEVTIRCVDQTYDSGEEAVWIEIESTDTNSGTRLEIFKILVPVSRLREGPFGVDDIRKAWVLRRNQQQPVRVEQADLQGLQLLFPGRLTEGVEEHEEKEAVAWQRGTLDCRVVTIRRTTQLLNQQATVKQTLLLHESVPLQLAGFRFDIALENANVKVHGRLTDLGTGAEAALPNAQ